MAAEELALSGRAGPEPQMKGRGENVKDPVIKTLPYIYSSKKKEPSFE